MTAYEITYIVRPDMDDEQTRTVIEGVTRRMESLGGEIITSSAWNPPRRRLAYPIRDFSDGYYVTTHFRIHPQDLRELENALRLNENVLRFLVVLTTEQSIKAAQQRLHQLHVAAAPAPQPEARSASEQPEAEPEAALPEAEAPAPEEEPITTAAPTTPEE